MKKFRTVSRSSEQKQGGARFFVSANLSLFAILLVCVIFFSCKSAPVEPSVPGVKVNAFDTLEEDSLVYIRIPVQTHRELSTNMLKAVIGSDVQERYIKHIIDNIQTVYIGAGNASDKKRLQIACDGKVSTIAKMGLAGADNWERRMEKISNSNFSVYTEADSKIELCIPGSDLVLISRDLVKPLTRYEAEAHAQLSDDEINDDWKMSEIYDFVGSDTSENVHIYMGNPLSFVARLLGVSLSSSIFQLNFIEADVKLLPSKKYAIDLDVEFSKGGLVSRASSFLNVAFLLTDSSVSIVDDKHLKVSGIQVSLEQFQKILGI